MIAHVAAAVERKGRVILSTSCGNASPLAIEAALLVAKAFEAELESLCIEDQQLIEVVSYSFAREISLSGRRSEALTPEAMAQNIRGTFRMLEERVSALARDRDIPTKVTHVRGEPILALANACAECGPWNVIALAEPLTATSGKMLAELFTEVKDATGVIAVGPKARLMNGPIVVAIEDVAHLEPMLRAAERLLVATGGDAITALLIGSADDLAELEGQARLLIGDRPTVDITVADTRLGLPAEVADVLRRQRGQFVLAQFGGIAVPGDHELRHLLAGLETPLFLIR